MKKLLNKIVLATLLLFFVVFSCVQVNIALAETSGGGTGYDFGTSAPSGNCKYSGAAFAYHAGTNYDGCDGYDGIYQLEYTWNKNCGDKKNLPSGVPRSFGSYLDASVTYKKEGAAFSSWSAAEEFFKSYNGGSDSLSNHKDWAHFCAYDKVTEETFYLTYDKNTTDTVSSMPSNTSCTTTTGSCSITVAGTPTRTNYVFNGWNTKSDGSGTGKVAGNSISMTNNRILYAQWIQYSHTLNYNLCSGSGTFNAQSATNASADHTFTIHSGSPTRTGYKFTGWSTTSCSGSVSKQPGTTISVGANASTTLYAIWEAYTVATFSAPAITITSTELTHISGDNYKAIGSKDNYSLTVYYHLTRTNNTPTSAVSQYGTRSADSHDGVYPNNTTNSNDLTYNVTQDISSPKTTPNITHGGWYNNICFYFKYDSKVYYDGTTRVGSAETSTTYRCINIYNPGQYHAAFTGWISVANGPGLSGTGENRVGNGYQSRFSYSPKYNIQRTDALNIPEKADSYVAINNVYTTFDEKYYPADNTADKRLTLALDNYEITYWPEDGWDWTYVDIGGAAQSRCYYLRYDSDVLYYDNERQYGNYAGRAHTCVSITNPPNTETISFTGTPVSATMTANNRLTRTDSNRVGTVINHDRNTSGTLCGSSSASVDSKIGKWCDNATARTATYTADFSHQITRNDNSSTILGKTMNASVS